MPETTAAVVARVPLPAMAGAPLPPPGPVLVALSGGVDSAVAAWRLMQAGYTVHGVHMKNWEDDDTFGDCPHAQELADVQAVAAHLGLPLTVVNFAREYRAQVFAAFLAEHRAGRTPNPDVLCNVHIKFGVLANWARAHGYRMLATGHYAALARPGPALCTAADADKDQTYFLSGLSGAQLDMACFPLADLRKAQVRDLARAAGLPVADKKDSTGICFIGERPFREFLGQYLPPAPGDITDPDGRVLGRHQGLAFYTLGQRAGLGIGGRADAPGARWRVAAKDAAQNRLVVVPDAGHPLLWAHTVRTGPAHFVAGAPPAARFTAHARIRHRGALAACVVQVQHDGALDVRFDVAQWAPAPGQQLVLYAGEQCLGGAVMEGAGAPADVGVAGGCDARPGADVAASFTPPDSPSGAPFASAGRATV